MTVRENGYAPLREYAAIGAGRTAALVAADGSVDWLCLPDFHSPSVFARILDAERGGSFRLEPEEPYRSERRYLPGTNVLETTFRTSSGVVRVTDAMTVADRKWISPLRELVRKVDGVAGSVALRWRFEPRFDYARRVPEIGRRAHRHVAVDGSVAIALGTWHAGEEEVRDGGVEGRFVAEAGSGSLLSLSVADKEPLVLTGRGDIEARLERTVAFWREWSDTHVEYDGPWREAVERSALALKLMTHAPSGAFVAAPTTSLPEWIGGSRNWDYRFTWPRDAAYTLFAFLNLGCPREARSFFWWLSHATQLHRPVLHPLYAVDGGVAPAEEELTHLEGYRGSRPVRIGNGAREQTQLDVYGAVLEAYWLYARATGSFDVESGRAVAKIADWVCEHWRQPDSGIWEVRSEPQHFVQSKVMCWVALDRACKLAEDGLLPDRRERWRRTAHEIREWVEREGWDEERGAYVRSSVDRTMDASLLTLCLFEFDTDPARLEGTIDAVIGELCDGALVARYHGEDGLEGDEGHFLTCSFWLVGALAKAGRLDEAAERMDDLLNRANDVGLYSEELTDDGTFLGNFPQALSHLALVNAAFAFERERTAQDQGREAAA